MAKFSLAILFVAGAVSAQAQPVAPQMPLQPSVDSAEQRQVLRNLSACLAEARPRWARQTLSQPYLSKAQVTDAAQALRATGSCMKGDKVEVMFRTSGLVAGMAEHFLLADIGRIEPDRLANALNKLTPLNASEDFALCIAARDPAAARELAFSEPGADAETSAARQVAAQVTPCTKPGETLTVDLQSLRALVATALYRGATSPLVALN